LNDSINELIAFKGKRTFENTIMPITNLDYQFGFETQPLALYSYVSSSKEMRDTSKLIDKAHTDFNIDLWMRDEVY
tara:strand:- start:13 stop:240 length:228 start_codon:yes stop_codon:yes gene_type:complete